MHHGHWSRAGLYGQDRGPFPIIGTTGIQLFPYQDIDLKLVLGYFLYHFEKLLFQNRGFWAHFRCSFRFYAVHELLFKNKGSTVFRDRLNFRLFLEMALRRRTFRHSFPNFGFWFPFDKGMWVISRAGGSGSDLPNSSDTVNPDPNWKLSSDSNSIRSEPNQNLKFLKFYQKVRKN